LGAFNLLVGVYLLSISVTIDFESGFLALVLGALAIGIYLPLRRGPRAFEAAIDRKNVAKPRVRTTLAGMTKTIQSVATKCQGVSSPPRKSCRISQYGRRTRGLYVWATRADLRCLLGKCP
jgi:hypothetical protein